MLFDLRGRGRRRTIQAIYLSLAVLMGGGLVFFGIGGNTSGGLFDAFSNNSGSSSDADKVFEERLKGFEERVRANPKDGAALAQLARLHGQIAQANFNATEGAYTEKGRKELGLAAQAWERYLALKPAKPDATVATTMVGVYSQGGLERYDKAVEAMEIQIEARPPSAGLYAQLAVLAAAAKQDRKSTLAMNKALELTPKEDRKGVKEQIELAKNQITAQPEAAPQSG